MISVLPAGVRTTQNPMTDLDMWITGSSTNYSQFSDADYDATIQSAKKGDLALDQDARWEALVGCEKTLQISVFCSRFTDSL